MRVQDVRLETSDLANEEQEREEVCEAETTLHRRQADRMDSELLRERIHRPFPRPFAPAYEPCVVTAIMQEPVKA